MDYESIYYQFEGQYKRINHNRLKEFIFLFCRKTKIDLKEIELIYSVQKQDYEDLFYSLKDYVFKFYPQYIFLFYRLLEESQYKMYYDILDGMFILGSTANKRLNCEKKELLLQSPNIKAIFYEDGKIIMDCNGEAYSFYGIRDYFRKNYDVMSYIRKNSQLSGNCHNVSWDLISILDESSLVTELLPYYYEGTFYHSIIRNEDGMYIDLANEVVYDEEIRQNLYQGQIVCQTKEKDLESNLNDAIVASNHPNIEEDFNATLLLALHKQMKTIRKE